MSDNFEDELDELERRLRAQWGTDTYSPPVIADEDKAIAAKLMGKADLAKLERTKAGERFRVTPKIVTKVEYFYVPPGNDIAFFLHAGWTIEVFENASKRPFARCLTDDQCAMAVTEMEHRGYDVRLIITEAMRTHGVMSPPRLKGCPQSAPPSKRPPSKPRQERSQRFAMLDQLKGFRR